VTQRCSACFVADQISVANDSQRADALTWAYIVNVFDPFRRVSPRTPRFWIIVVGAFVVGFILVSGVQDAVGGGELGYNVGRLVLIGAFILAFGIAAKGRGRDAPRERRPSE